MKILSKVSVFLFLIGLQMMPGLQASDLKFFSANFPPYTYPTENGGAGAIHDVTKEIIRRLGYKNKIEFIPWARARFEAENNPEIVLLPLARTKEREDKYTWLLHVLDDPYVLVTLKNSKVDISSVEASRNLKVGILTSSVADTLLRELGYTNLVPASTDVQNVKKLKLGRIDAWVAPLSCIGEYKKEADLGKEDMRVGVTLTVLKEYVGASKRLDSKIVTEWTRAFEEMKKDGTYLAIMKKYGMVPLKL